jgi:hypothetical protein
MSSIDPPILFAVLLAACTSCTSPGSQSWQKAGTSEQTMSRDTAECRESANEDARRRYPYRAGSPSLGAAGAMLSQQRDDNDRAAAEASLFDNCMQSRGYRRAAVSR